MKIINLLILSLLMANGCIDDAPRDNPLDPESDRYVARGLLTGRIVIAHPTQSVGIAGVEILNEFTSFSVTSDSAGYFTFLDLPAGVQRFIAAKQNFTNDTFSIEIRSGSPAQIVRGLNGAPYVTYRQIVSHKIDYVEINPRYYVDVTAAVTDPNGIADLDSAWFGVENFRFPLSYSVNTKNFTTAVENDTLPTNTIEWLIGKPLTIISRDIHGAVNTSDPFYITRVIENTAVPIAKDTTNGTPLFTWKPPTVSFSYTSTVTVARRGTETVVWKYPGLLSFYEELQYPTNGTVTPLTPGNYFWTITIVDEFGNSSRSQESYFVVK